MPTIDDVLTKIDANQTGALERLFSLLSIPSVSTDPARAEDCVRAADWLVGELKGLGFGISRRGTDGKPMGVGRAKGAVAPADWLVGELKGLGFEISRRETDGKPMVVGHAKGTRRDAPHVLFYGHYDVQPPEPLNLWEKPPFEPRIVDTPTGQRIVARGACDDKGQLMTFVEACRAFRETGCMPLDVSVLFEGEEEIGSPSLPGFMSKNARELKADVMLVCDTGMWDRSTPAITTMLRGLLYEEVILRGANRDLHSGLFGGAAINPIRVLARILAE